MSSNKHEAWVDYSLGENLQTYTLKSYFNTTEEIVLGDSVLTKDDFGNSCEGVVGNIDREIVRIDLDKETYKPRSEGYDGN